MEKNDFNENEAIDTASQMGQNATAEDVKNVEANMGKMNRGPLKKIWYKVTQLWDAFKSPNTPKSLKVIIIGGLIYMVSPIDLIPDFIPVAGLLDDVFVIGNVFSKLVALMAIANASIKLVKINEENIRKEMEKRKLEKIIITNMSTAPTIDCLGINKDASQHNICQALYKIDCLGINKDGSQEQVSFESSNGIDDALYVGMEIYA